MALTRIYIKTKKAIYFWKRGLICAIFEVRQVTNLPIGKIKFDQNASILQTLTSPMFYSHKLWRGNALGNIY